MSRLAWRHYNILDEFFLSYSLASVDADFPPITAERLKFNKTVNQGIESVVFTHADIIAGVNTRTPLPDDYRPCPYLLSGISLHAKSLGLAVSPQSTGAASLFMRHLASPLSLAAVPSGRVHPPQYPVQQCGQSTDAYNTGGAPSSCGNAPWACT